MNYILEIQHLSFRYEKKRSLLTDVSFSLPQGSLTALLGKNGSGKSTLLDCLLGCRQKVHGNILIDGTNSKTLSQKRLAQKIAYIPQNTLVTMDYTVLEFLLFGRSCHLAFGQSPTSEDIRLAQNAAEECGVTHLLSRPINQLSGGERQLVFTARALTQQSPVILMDEPSSALDFGNQARLLARMKKLQNTGKTILFTTHHPADALRLNCHVIALKDGKIAAFGTAAQIITKALIQELYGNDFEIHGLF